MLDTPTSTDTRPIYNVTLRNLAGEIMHGATFQAADPAGAREDFFKNMPAPFNDYEVLGSDKTGLLHRIGLGPFEATLHIERRCDHEWQNGQRYANPPTVVQECTKCGLVYEKDVS